MSVDWQTLAARLRAADEGHERALEAVDEAERVLEAARAILIDAAERKTRAKGALYDAAFEEP